VPLIGQDGSRIREVLEGGDNYPCRFNVDERKNFCRHPEVLAAQRRASKDEPQALTLVAILGDAAQVRGSLG
jgi:hypothetical protein